MDPSCLDRHNPPPRRSRNGGVKTAAWRTFRGRSTLHRAVKNKRVTVQGPVKKPPMDDMSHRGTGGGRDIPVLGPRVAVIGVKRRAGAGRMRKGRVGSRLQGMAGG